MTQCLKFINFCYRLLLLQRGHRVVIGALNLVPFPPQVIWFLFGHSAWQGNGKLRAALLPIKNFST